MWTGRNGGEHVRECDVMWWRGVSILRWFQQETAAPADFPFHGSWERGPNGPNVKYGMAGGQWMVPNPQPSSSQWQTLSRSPFSTMSGRTEEVQLDEVVEQRDPYAEALRSGVRGRYCKLQAASEEGERVWKTAEGGREEGRWRVREKWILPCSRRSLEIQGSSNSWSGWPQISQVLLLPASLPLQW